jgi:LuxR family transcriptional regulator, quorum-sensing system regulator CviR
MSINYQSLSDADISGHDALALLEIINRSLSCTSKNDFADLFASMQIICPFDYALALLGRVESNRFVTQDVVENSMPDAFIRAYVPNNYLRTDALAAESAVTQRLRYWPDDWARLSQRQEIVSLCMDTGVKTGFIHVSKPTALSNKNNLICFSGLSIQKDKRTVAIINLLMPHIHLALSRMPNKILSADKRIVLSEREKEVLNWLKLGKSSWDMSVILGISERTVNFHVYNMMRKLEAVNRPQVVAAAIHLGLIDAD